MDPTLLQKSLARNRFVWCSMELPGPCWPFCWGNEGGGLTIWPYSSFTGRRGRLAQKGKHKSTPFPIVLERQENHLVFFSFLHFKLLWYVGEYICIHMYMYRYIYIRVYVQVYVCVYLYLYLCEEELAKELGADVYLVVTFSCCYYFHI